MAENHYRSKNVLTKGVEANGGEPIRKVLLSFAIVAGGLAHPVACNLLTYEDGTVLTQAGSCPHDVKHGSTCL